MDKGADRARLKPPCRIRFRRKLHEDFEPSTSILKPQCARRVLATQFKTDTQQITTRPSHHTRLSEPQHTDHNVICNRHHNNITAHATSTHLPTHTPTHTHQQNKLTRQNTNSINTNTNNTNNDHDHDHDDHDDHDRDDHYDHQPSKKQFVVRCLLSTLKSFAVACSANEWKCCARPTRSAAAASATLPFAEPARCVTDLACTFRGRFGAATLPCAVSRCRSARRHTRSQRYQTTTDDDDRR